jgi:hypothetical protein
MDKFKLYNIKYKRKKIILIYCNYNNFGQYSIKRNGFIIVCINNTYNNKLRSKLLHRAIRNNL